jgi:hypothetical protein
LDLLFCGHDFVGMIWSLACGVRVAKVFLPCFPAWVPASRCKQAFSRSFTVVFIIVFWSASKPG